MKAALIFGILLIALPFFSIVGAAVDQEGIYYSIHNGSYRVEKNARAYAAEVEKIGLPTFIDRVDIPKKGVWYRVYIGKYPDVKSAKAAVPVLKKNKINDLARIVKFSGGRLKQTSPLLNRKSAEDKATQKTRTESPGFQAKTPINKVAERDRTPDGDIRTKEKPSLAHPVLAKADAAIRDGRCPEAMALLDQWIGRGDHDKKLSESAQRMRAECLFKIGMTGDPRARLKAVENGKALLKNYPDPAAGNDLIYRNMAQSYKKLNFFYEAAEAWDRIVLGYKDSSFFEEALFRSGYDLIPTRKKEKIYEKLSRYVKMYPDGLFAGQAYYALGWSLCLMGNGDQAVRLFDLARKRWPDFVNIDKNIMEVIGDCYFKAGRYKDVLPMSFFIASVYPDTDLARNALFLSARSADLNGDAALSLKLYGLFVEKYPHSKEASECTFFMANLGVERPGLKAPDKVLNVDSYTNPLTAYDRLLANKSSTADMEQVMLWRGKALEKKGDFRSALDNYLEMHKRYPRGNLIKDLLQHMKKSIVVLVDSCYAEKDYPSIAEIYFKLKGRVSLGDERATGIKMGKSLQQIGLYAEARGLYNQLAIQEKAGNDLELALAQVELDIAMKNPVAAEYKLSHFMGKQVKEYGKSLLEITKKLADLYSETGNVEKAAAFYAKAIAMGGQKDPILHLHYGWCLEAKKMTAAAEKAFQTALILCENRREKCENDVFLKIYSGRGDVYFAQKKFDSGVGMYRKALEYASDDESKRWLMLRLGKAYNGMDDFDMAKKIFSRIKEPPDGEFWPAVADFYISDAQRQEGRIRQ